MTEGKGRPTPKRKEAQIKPGASLSPALTKEQKKAQKAELRAKRLAQRDAYMRGDESALSSRDRGPVRRFVRNTVDSRLNIGEYFLPIIFLVLLLSMTRNQYIAVMSIIAMYIVLLIAIIDGVLLGRRVKRKVTERFPNESTKGLAMYAFLRSTQMRRMRAPRPLVKRGEKNF
ncbi:MAG: DUF3043 domain-containing protein [Candidatus Nanopelagicaceae bacterium]